MDTAPTNKNFVWIIHIEWVDDCNCADNTYCYDSKGKALEAFDKLVREELSDCWGGVINENGTIAEGYVLERTSDSMTVYEDGNYCLNHEVITLKKYEIL